MYLSRRTLLSIAPGAVAAVALASCTPAEQATITAAYDNFLAQVQAIVAKGCSIGTGFIPAIPSIEAVVNILFPGLGTAVAGVAGAVGSVAQALCGATANTPPAALAHRLRASSSGNPVYIGTIVVGGNQVQVAGYR
jgi:hypothetical protein